MKHFRLIFTKVLLTKIWLGLYLYNSALSYFLELELRMPVAMARPFGQMIGSYLRDETSPMWLYGLFSLWFTIALQLLVTAVAWDYRNEWKLSVICYTIGVPLMITFLFNFTVLHMPNWKPPSSLPENS